MRTLLRRRVIVPAAVAVVLVAVATGTAWYLLGEERRMGSTIERVLAGRTGLPITIQRASWNGSRLRLRDVRLPADPGRPIDVRIGQLDVDAPLMTLVSPAGRTISLVATAVSVTLTAPDATGAGGIEPLRTGLLAFLGWSAMLRWRSEGTELRAPGGALTLDLAGEKRGTGLTASITLVPSAGGEPLRLDVRGAAALGRSVDLAVDLTGPPDVIAGLLPDVALPASAVSGRVQLQLVAGGVVSASGRLSLEANAPKPTALDFAARYDSASGSLGVSRYTLRWRDDVRLTGAARLERSDRARRLTVTAEGDAADAKVKATLGYELDGGAFEADVEADALDADRARRFGLDVPLEIHARGVHARVAGRVSPDMVIARVDATAAQVSSALRQSVPVGASVRATVSVARGADGLRVRSVQDGKLGLTREGAPLLTATVASPPTAPWPLAIAVSVADLGRAAPLLPVPAVLSGSAQLKGSLAAARPPTFRGTVDARLPRARLEAGGPIELSEVRLEAPVTAGVRGDPPPGAFGVARVIAYGLALENVTGQARLADDRALLAELLYTQYGGTGTGWMDATRRAGSPPFQGRFEADGIDLARFVKESGASVARISGTVRYVATVQYVAGVGLVADAHIESTRGGEVSIDAIEALLGSVSVESESTGILRRTLENLRAFEYERLEGDLRYRGSGGFIDLSLRGKKRLGIFPAPVEALNFRNVPLSLLVRTLTKGSAP